MSELILQNQGQETHLDGPSCLFISEGQSAHLPQSQQMDCKIFSAFRFGEAAFYR